MTYQTLLHKLAPDLNPAGIEASMHLHYGTLNHLPRETFAAEAKLAADLEGLSPGILRKIADSMGMADKFFKWEAIHAALSGPAQPDLTERDHCSVGGRTPRRLRRCHRPTARDRRSEPRRRR